LLPNWLAICGAVGILFSACYLLWTLQRMFFGSVSLKGGDIWRAALVDLKPREIIALVPLALTALALGVMPSLVFDKINDSVLALVSFTKTFIR